MSDQGRTPPGWYRDAQGVRRWFDGEDWTDHTQPDLSGPPQGPPPQGPPPQGPAPQGPPRQVPPPGFPAPPGYPAPGWGPGGYPPPGKRARRGLLIALGSAGVVAVVAGVVVLALIFGGGGDNEPTAGDPTTSEPTEPEPEPTEPEPTEPEPTEPEPTEPEPPTLSPPPSSEPTAEPDAVVDAFLQAVKTGDCPTAEGLLTQRLLRQQGECQRADATDELDWEIRGSDVRGDSATVRVDLRLAGEDTAVESEIGLVAQGGQWLIDALFEPAEAPAP